MSGTRINAVKGMHDLLPESAPLWQRIETTARRVFGLYGFEEIRTPLVEPTALFVRGIGEDTDVVGKEMYSFVDKGEEPLSLRPEGTASAVRAYVEHDRHTIDPIQKWFYYGPMFRRERPGKGRYRQFHQIGAELFGVADPRADIEMIAVVHRFLTEVGVSGVVLRMNSLGDADSRPAYREALVQYFTPHEERLGETDRQRLKTNPLRLLDSKDPAVVELAGRAPSTLDHLSPASAAHFQAVKDGLSALGVPFEVDPSIVRGLDYYTRTTFEFVATSGLGSQSTVAGGGRYDGMVAELGGPPTPAIGFALGVERLAMLLEVQAPAAKRGPDLFLGTHGEGDAVTLRALQLAETCRTAGLRVEVTLKPVGVGKQLQRANRVNARFAAVVGDGELQSGTIKLKELATGRETPVLLVDLPSALRGLLENVTP
jgi:histidyl-tRNA synthetase